MERKVKGKTPVVALCYDFDRTLSPCEMQAQGYIQAVGCDIAEFWSEADYLAVKNGMDKNLAYMYLMVNKAKNNFPLTKEALEKYGSEVKLFSGVENWFARISRFGADCGICVEHYVISSGLKEMIEGTAPAKSGMFEQIYASCFYFGADGEAEWPAQVINYTNKTQFLFRISKGVTDINDEAVNDYFQPDEIRVPFENFIYIGDSDTDIPCMKLVSSHGGNSIGVFNPDSGNRLKVEKMLKENRINHIAAADYKDGG